MRARSFMIVFVSLLCVSPVFAQDHSCTAIVQEAVITIQDDCAATGRNQACYGNVMLEATPREGVQNFTFAQQGDLVNVVDLDSLHLSSLDPAQNLWGVALMQLQANLPDTLPGQNVTFLLFGNVEIYNEVPAGAPTATLKITSTGNINVRSGPSTNAGVIASLGLGETVTANARNQDSSWLRIRLTETDSLGWVFADLVDVAGEVSLLPVVDAGDATLPNTPMQAFRFSSGIGSANCTGAPPDGILIQTPQGAGKIELRANGVDIQLGSTGYLQAQPGATMTVMVLEGEGSVSANGGTVTVPEGAQTQIPLDADLNPTDAPGEPEPYDADFVEPLPVQALPEAISIAPPASEALLTTVQDEPDSGVFTGALPGMGGDFAALQGMDRAFFCDLMDNALGQSGVTREQYVAMLNQTLGFVPAENRQSVEEFIALLNSCPG